MFITCKNDQNAALEIVGFKKVGMTQLIELQIVLSQHGPIYQTFTIKID